MKRSTAPSEPWPLGQPMPAAMTPADLQRVLQLKSSQFFRYQRAGRLRQFEIKNAIGNARFSGLKVQRYVNAHPVTTFGRSGGAQ